MILFLDIVSFLIEWAYAFVFFFMLLAFLPTRKNRLIRVLAFFGCSLFSHMVIYSNDLPNLAGALIVFTIDILIFHKGRWMEKLTAVLVFYPPVIAVNYLMLDVSSRLFFLATGAPGTPSSDTWTPKMYLISTAVHTFALLLRLLFWLLSWWFLRKYLRQTSLNLTNKMWSIVDALMLSPFVAIFTIIYFMPESPVIVYPICATSIFSGFGCIYLASYICNSMQTAYHAQELEMKEAYYKEQIKNETQVRSIYHDLKNHLLILEAQAGNKQEVQTSIQELQSQIQEYEFYQHTGNEFLDIILRDKAKAALERQIDFSAVISFEDTDFIDPLDISTIFGNALDNAMEACARLPKEERLITVKANRIRDFLIINVENSTAPDSSASGTFSGKTTKKDTFLHGFGLPNIKNAVEHYHGQCNVKFENETFTLKIMIPIPS